MNTLQALLEQRDRNREQVRATLDTLYRVKNATPGEFSDTDIDVAREVYLKAVGTAADFEASPTDDPALLQQFSAVQLFEEDIRVADVRAAVSGFYAQVAALPATEQEAMGVFVPNRAGAEQAAGDARAAHEEARRDLAIYLCDQGVHLPSIAKQAGIVVQEFTLETSIDEDGMDVHGASISDEEMEELLAAQPGIVYARNQDGVLVEMMLDMDEQSPIVRPVLLTPEGVIDLHPRDGAADNAGPRP